MSNDVLNNQTCNDTNCQNNPHSNYVTGLCNRCMYPECSSLIYDKQNDAIKINPNASYYFKCIPSFQFVADFLHEVCIVEMGGMYFDAVCYKRLKLLGMNHTEQMKFFYYKKYHKFPDQMDSVKGYMNIIRQLCRLYDIPIEKKRAYNGRQRIYRHFIKIEDFLPKL